MALRRVLYALILIASAVSFVVTDSGVALFMLVCLASLPVLSFIMLFFAVRKVKFAHSIRESCIRGGALQINMQVSVAPRFLVGAVIVVADIENTTFGKRERKNFLFKDLTFTPHTFEYVSPDCGRICVTFAKLRLVDLFGICSVNIRRYDYAESFVSPKLYGGINVTVGMNGNTEFSGEFAIPQRGNDHTEIFDIRDYVAGDGLNTIHWKLSGKFDDLKVKEFGSSVDHRTVILVDLSRNVGGMAADDGQINAVLDAAVSVSGALQDAGYAHTVGWFNDGNFSSADVYDGNSLYMMVNALMSIKVHAGNAEPLFYFSRTPEAQAFTKVILITPYANEEELKSVRDYNLTVFAVSNTLGEVNAGNVKIINSTSEKLQETLAYLAL